MKPVVLGPNQPRRFYRGGEAIAGFRGIASVDDHLPEDWVGSTTSIFGEDGTGLTVLPEGRLLRDALAADPKGFLGPDHTNRYGADPALLVKLLDAGERLPVHVHPDGAFAQQHLGLPYGKTEAWVIVEARGASPFVYLGFREDVDADTLADWVLRGDDRSLLDALHELAVAPGDCIFVPAGLPHALGAGVFLVELQEPSDLSVLLESTRFDFDPHLGLGLEVALQCVNRAGLGSDEIAALRRETGSTPEVRPGARSLLPSGAEAYFRAERLQPDPAVALEAGFSILVVLEGQGHLVYESGEMLALARGETVLVPYATGPTELRGRVEAVRCLPPLVG